MDYTTNHTFLPSIFVNDFWPRLISIFDYFWEINETFSLLHALLFYCLTTYRKIFSVLSLLPQKFCNILHCISHSLFCNIFLFVSIHFHFFHSFFGFKEMSSANSSLLHAFDQSMPDAEYGYTAGLSESQQCFGMYLILYIDLIPNEVGWTSLCRILDDLGGVCTALCTITTSLLTRTATTWSLVRYRLWMK